MLKRQFFTCLIAVFGFLHVVAAPAATINLIPSSDVINVNDPLTVDIVITGLGPTEIVSTFDIDISYNDSVLDLTGVTFGNLLGDPFDPIDTLVFDFPVPGTVGLFETSFLDDFTLGILQDDGDPLANSVFLASLSFLSIGVGSGGLEFTVNDIFGGLFDPPLQLSSTTGAVAVSVIPLPGAAWLMLTGLLGIGFASRKRGAGIVGD